MDKYLYKEIYTMNKTLSLVYPVESKINIDDEKNAQVIIDSKLTSYFTFIEESTFTFDVKKTDTLKSDGYSVRTRTNSIEILYTNKRSLRYAIEALLSILNQETNNNNNSYYNNYKLVYIVDEPSFRLRGIIEGYYGTPWTYEERKDMVSFMDKTRLNVYMYAPKSDVYHREKWDVLYPQDELTKLINLKNDLKEKDIDFFYCISPGYKKDGCKAFDYCNNDDYEILFRKLDQVIDKGVTKFGLLLDDIDYTLSGKALEIYKTPGVAHSDICNKVYKYLSSKITENFEMVMCPTEYVQIGSTPYRQDIMNNMNKDIAVFWTGLNCCAEVMLANDAKLTKEAYGTKLFIWDNFPVSDFTYGVRQYIAPVMNRSSDICKYADAYIINPMKDYYLSKASMFTMADYSWNSYRYDYEKSFTMALNDYAPTFYKDSIDYINFNYPSVISFGNLDNEYKLVENKDYQSIKQIYHKACISAKKIMTYDLGITEELTPWLNHLFNEYKVVQKIIKAYYSVDGFDKQYDKIRKQTLTLLKDIKFSGSELLDYLIKDFNLLTIEEYETLITKRRGRPWYRVWEVKR